MFCLQGPYTAVGDSAFSHFFYGQRWNELGIHNTETESGCQVAILFLCFDNDLLATKISLTVIFTH